MVELVGDGCVGGHADACDRQIRLVGQDVCIGADHMIQQIHGVCWDGIGVQPLRQGNRSLLKRPHVDATIGPVSKQ